MAVNQFTQQIQQKVGGPQPPPVNFGVFKDQFSSKMNFIKRRFSSSDLVEDGPPPPPPQAGIPQSSSGLAAAQQAQGPPPQGMPPGQQQRPESGSFNLQGLTNKMSSTISAPTSPAKGQQIGGPASMTQSMYSQVTGFTKNLVQAATGQKPAGYEHAKCLLVIDDQRIDWSKYFRNKKILADWDVRVEQAEFSELSMASYSDAGCMVELHQNRGGNRIVRSFKPDFVLIRQHVHDCDKDWRNIIIGLLYGGVPSINSLSSIYSFYDKPWVFSHLLLVQRKLGKDKFPLIDQAYWPDYRHMNVSATLPVVVKVGHAHRGLGKMKINTAEEFSDVAGIVAIAKSSYCTTEQFVDSKFDVHIQKIGANYKAFMYKLWIDEAAQLFGGLDICSIGCLFGKDGKEYIFELNDSSFDLLGETQEEDRRHIVDLVLLKMNNILGFRQALNRKESLGAMAPQNFIRHEMPTYGQQNVPPPTGMQGAQPPAQRPPGPQMDGYQQQYNANAVGPPQGPRPPGPTQQQGPLSQMGGPGPQNYPPQGPPQQRPMGPPPTQQQHPQMYGGPPPGQVPQGLPPNQQQQQQPQPGPNQPLQQQQQLPGQPPYSGPPRGPPPPRPARQPSLTSQQSLSKDDPNAVPSQNPDDTMSSLKKTFAGIFGDM